jgi:Spy/CpxP family protein refolding chaperone
MFPTVHPSLIDRWKRARFARACGIPLGCGSSGHAEAPGAGFFASEFSGGLGGGAFGVRRPLRLLAYKLGLSDAQVAELARILNDLKTERAQAAVDDRRTLTSLADALAGETFDEALANQGAELRRKGAERLAEAVVKALGRIHKLLDPEQRERLAYLIRTGALVL